MPVATVEPLATVEALEALLDRAYSATESMQLLMELRQASTIIRRRAGQFITLVEDDVQELRGNWGSEFYLPQIPVQNVEELSVRFVGDTMWTSLSADGYIWDSTGCLTYASPFWVGERYQTGGYWGGIRGTVRAKYTHGYDPTVDADARVLADVESVCLAIARRRIDSGGGGVQSETMGAYSVTYATPDADGLLPTELDVIKRLRNPRL